MYLQPIHPCIALPAATPPEAVLARLASIIDLARKILRLVVGRHPADAVLMPANNRLVRLARRVASMVQQIEAGTWKPRPPRTRKPPEPAPEPPPEPAAEASPAPPRQRRHPPEPRQWGWLRRLIPTHHLGPCNGGLYQLLCDPQMHALLAAAPCLGRQFRPLCRMLGVKPHAHFPPELFPPRPPRKRKPKPKPEPGPEPEPFVYYSAAPPIVASKYGPPDWRDTTRTHTRTMRLGSFIIERPKHLRTKRRKNPA